jgi:hypothetical protein
MDERIGTLLQGLLDMRGENRNAIIEGTCRLFAECERQFCESEIAERKTDEAARTCQTLMRNHIVEQIEVEERTGNEDTAAYLRDVLSIYIVQSVIDRPGHEWRAADDALARAHR